MTSPLPFRRCTGIPAPLAKFSCGHRRLVAEQEERVLRRITASETRTPLFGLEATDILVARSLNASPCS
jgi:hypothetical protein